MTVLQRYPGTGEILQRLDDVQVRRRRVRLATGALVLASVVATSLLVTAATGYWPGQPPVILRWSLLLGACGAWAAVAAWLVLRAVLWRQNPAQVARYVEEALPEVRNDLINTVLLSGGRDRANEYLISLAIREAAARCRRVDVTRSISMRRLKRWGIVAFAAGALLATFAWVQPGPFKRGLFATVTPGRYVPNFGSIRLLELTPGDTACFVGEQVKIVAKVRNESARPLEARVLIEGGDAHRVMLAGDDNTTFTCTLGSVDESFRYAVCIGDSRFPTDLDYREYYTVTVRKRVDVRGIDLRYEYPPYTRMEPKTETNCDGKVEAPAGSRADVTLRVSDPVPSAVLLVTGGAPTEMRPSPDHKSFTATLPIRSDGEYRMELKDKSGGTLQRIPDPGDNGEPVVDAFGPTGQAMMRGCYPIRAVPDAPPRIGFAFPNRNVTLAPGSKLTIEISAADDYGLTAVTLLAGREGAPPKPLKRFDARGKRLVRFTYTFDLVGLAANDAIVYHAEATDNRQLPSLSQGSQTTGTRRFRILILIEELRSRLLAILKMQEPQRVNTEICLRKHTQIAQIAATARRIVAVQTRIHAEFVDLLKNFRFDDDTRVVREVISALTADQTVRAIAGAKELAALKSPAARETICPALAGAQDEIIKELHALLAIIPSLTTRQPPADGTPEGGDIPPEVREKLAELKTDLESFIDEQSKIVRSSDRLAKKPVDVFTPEDEKLLKNLQALQDKWEKFLNEKFADFSKLGEQDMSNPVLLKELVSVKSDVTMARDALSKKAVEIATALEDNGIENARTLTANIEKWLMDEPDRTKWSMEDPAGQENVEQPELPSELEDLVGDLLEQEEDLFEQMDDLTGKYPFSGDKGIGWDAMDGPMSSMNAQGVTGNALPNTSEQSGRSGEGRSGKSSGEFVEDKAVGKGGRRTPTRLTPEPFQKGQIDDFSQEPPGGATGGGKLSGSGAEGLEGPVPPPLAQELDRLAGRQAAIINTAERLRERFKVNDYAGFRFLQAVALMNRVRSDLANHRYHNALRSRDVTLAALKQTREILDGKIDVTGDDSAAMPKYVRDDIADARKGKLPAEYRDVLQQYYRRLSEESQK